MRSLAFIAIAFVCGCRGPRPLVAANPAPPPLRPSGAESLVAPPVNHPTSRGRVVDIGLGWQHTCALLDDTTVRCWGRGDQGQVGDGTGEDRNRPTTVIARTGVLRGTTQANEPVLRGAVQLAVGHDHSCARMHDGTVQCWGSNSAGQAGSGPPYSAWSPRFVPQLASVLELVSGPYHVCARLQDGTVRCWGANHAGKPALRNRDKLFTHEAIGGLGPVAKLVVGESSACAVHVDGTVSCWDGREFGNGEPKKATLVSGISDAVDAEVREGGGCAILRDGRFSCWGARPRLPPAKAVATIAVGEQKECVVFRDRTAQCGGHYRAALTNVIKVVPGGTHGCAIVEPGSLRCWGSTEYGQLGNGAGRVRSLPAQAKGISAAIGLSVGASNCARMSAGEVKCWGPNSSTLLGRRAPAHYAPEPVPFDELRGVAQVSIGGNIAVALRADGTVLSWGNDDAGVPKAVLGLKNAVEVAAANERACALLKDGSMWCWGADSFGELGRGVLPVDGANNVFGPTRVPGLSRVGAMALGEHHTCVVLDDKTVRCWGMADYGRLGNGVVKPYSLIPTPTVVPKLQDVKQIVSPAGGGHTCVVRGDGAIWCWGGNAYGAFGTWDKEQEQEVVRFPVAARGIVGVEQIACSSGATCGRFSDNSVKCWGGGSYGEVGDGTTEVRARPVVVPGMGDVVELGAGESHFCARKRDGTIWCWGKGDFGRTGDGSLNQVEEPEEVRFWEIPSFRSLLR